MILHECNFDGDFDGRDGSIKLDLNYYSALSLASVIDLALKHPTMEIESPEVAEDMRALRNNIIHVLEIADLPERLELVLDHVKSNPG